MKYSIYKPSLIGGCLSGMLTIFIMLTYTFSYGQAKDSLKIKGRDSISKNKIDSLPPVTVRPKFILPYLKGDTLEFNTSSVRLRPNATVEELLRQLPGAEVDANGVITINGRKIEHLLVDGEDLFGNNPPLITRNFTADMIAKIQVLDRKSDMAVFSSIDDGVRTRTLNLVLKDEAKHSYFLKAAAGGDTQGYYNCNGMLGSFKDRRQLVALGMVSNIGQSSSNGNAGDEGVALSVSNDVPDALEASAGTGIPRIKATGLHYANWWNGEEGHLTGNYQYNDLFTKPTSSSTVVQLLPDSTYTQAQENRSINSQQKHVLDVTYDYTPDTSSAYGISLGGVRSQGHNELFSAGNSSFNDTLVNSSQRTIHSDVQNDNFHGFFVWRTRGKGKNHNVLASNLGIIKENTQTAGYLYSVSNFYTSGRLLPGIDTTDQRKVINNSSFFIAENLLYSIRFSRKINLGILYGFAFDKSNSLQGTYGKGDGKYLDYIDSLSSHYQEYRVTHRTNISLDGTVQALNYSLSCDVSHFSYRETDLSRDSAFKYPYYVIAPNFRLGWNINNHKTINFSYEGATQAPTIIQLQPLQNNNDPLHISIGNPHLQSSFNHNFILWMDILRPSIINVTANFRFVSNQMSVKTYTDSLGRQVSQTVNADGTYNAGIGFSFNHNLRSLDLNYGFTSSLAYGHTVSFVNALLSQNDSYNAGGGVRINKYVADQYSFNLNSGVNYSYLRSSINALPTKYWTQYHNLQVSVFPFQGFEAGSSAEYSWRQKTSNFDKNNTTVMWNAYINKNFFNNQLTIGWRINDILAQNAGITRTISNNQVAENVSNIIGRYWMVSAVWRMKHIKKDKEPNK